MFRSIPFFLLFDPPPVPCPELFHLFCKKCGCLHLHRLLSSDQEKEISIDHDNTDNFPDEQRRIQIEPEQSTADYTDKCAAKQILAEGSIDISSKLTAIEQKIKAEERAKEEARREVMAKVADALKPDKQADKSDFDEDIKRRLQGLI